MDKYVRFFEELGIADVPLVGGKNASLGEMYRKLSPAGVRVPNGFAITADGYRHMLETAGAWAPLHAALDDLKPDDVSDLARRAKRAREIVYGAGLPRDLADEIRAAYRRLQQEYGPEVSLAVRSSATAEDLPNASFAGQHETFLNIHGDESLLDACRRCFASLFTDRAIHYRIDNGFDQFKVALSIGVMKMVRSDLAAAGVMFSLDTESGFRDVVFITSAYGLAENIVQGAVDPDEFYVHKPTYRDGHRAVLRRNLGSKAKTMVLGHLGPANVQTSADDRHRFSITDDEVLELTGQAVVIEEHYGRPMDIEWAKDGVDGLLYIVQARPETVASQRSATQLDRYVVGSHGRTLALDGMTFSVRPGRVTGFVGPNGAGKSTTMRVILGLDAVEAGQALVGGQPYHRLRHPLRQLGSLLDAAAVQPSRSARNHLLWLARSQRLPDRRVDEVLELAGLSGVARRRAGGFSLGMRQRLGIAAALLGDPAAIMLDEPFNGMDPEGIMWMRELLRGLAAQGRTVLVSSHLMSELQDTAGHLVVIGRGRLVADTSVAELIATASSGQITVRTTERSSAMSALANAGATVAVTGPDTLTVSGLPAGRVVGLMNDAAVPFSEVAAHRATLEEAYMDLTRNTVEFRAGELQPAELPVGDPAGSRESTR